jgi:hypothetical protein
MADRKRVLDLEEPLDLSAMRMDTTCVNSRKSPEWQQT